MSSFLSLTGLSPSLAGFPKTFLLGSTNQLCGPNPTVHAPWFGLFPFRSPLLWKSIFLSNERTCFFLFLRLLRCFSSPGSLPYVMDWRMDDWSSSSRVSPFRYLRLNGYLLLPAAFRSLSRLSSALSAKASTLRSYQLNHYPLKMHLYQMICVKRLHLSTFPKAGRIALRPWSVEFLLLNKIVSYSVFRFASFDAPRMS